MSCCHNRTRFRPHFKCNCGQFFVIRNQHSGLVLDASQYHVQLQHFTGFATQLWRLESINNGRFYIVNKSTGNVLDIQGGPKPRANLITFRKHGGDNQQWYLNSDETIVSAVHNLAIDIYEGFLTPGNRLIVFPKHGLLNQQFQLQYQ